MRSLATLDGVKAIAERRRAPFDHLHMPPLNAVLIALPQKVTPVIIVTNNSHCLDVEGRIKLLQVDRHVAAGASTLPIQFDIGVHRVFSGPSLKRFVIVDNPRTCSQDTPSHRHHRISLPSTVLR